jgi:hypothetical protein
MPAAKKIPLYKQAITSRKLRAKAEPNASDAAQPSLPLVSTATSMEHRRSEVQSIIKTACDFLNADGVEPRNYVEQLAWMFFLKAYDQAEDNRTSARLFEGNDEGEDPDALLSGEYRWSRWTADTSKPDAMLAFVNEKLWPKLTNLGASPAAQRFQRIFSTVRNYCRKGIIFAKVVEQVNKLHFSDRTDVLLLSEIYESLLKQVAADSAGYAGEFYTQRHIIRAMIQVVNPKLGERIYDPCFGSAGFLTECATHLQRAASMSGEQWDKLQNNTFFGIEFKPLSYLLGHMNPGAAQPQCSLTGQVSGHPGQSALRRQAGPPASDELHHPLVRHRDSLPPAHHGQSRRRRPRSGHRARGRPLPWWPRCEGSEAPCGGV